MIEYFFVEIFLYTEWDFLTIKFVLNSSSYDFDLCLKGHFIYTYKLLLFCHLAFVRNFLLSTPSFHLS